MIEIHSEPGRAFLTIKLSGLVTLEDIQDAMPTLLKKLSETQSKGLLGDWTELKEWSEEARSVRFFARIEVRSDVQNLAILAERDWQAEVDRLREIVRIPVRHFLPSDVLSAQAWLETDAA